MRLIFFVLFIGGCSQIVSNLKKLPPTSSAKVSDLQESSPAKCLQELPFHIEDCEGESCGEVYYEYPSIKEVKLYEFPDHNSKVIETIHECEKFKNLKQFLNIYEFYKAKITRVGEDFEKHNLKKGDIIQITHYTGEGTWGACIGKDNVKWIQEITDDKYPTYPIDGVEFITPKIEKLPKVWVYVTSIRNKSGWSDEFFWFGKYSDETFWYKKCEGFNQ